MQYLRWLILLWNIAKYCYAISKTPKLILSRYDSLKADENETNTSNNLSFVTTSLFFLQDVESEYFLNDTSNESEDEIEDGSGEFSGSGSGSGSGLYIDSFTSGSG